MAFTDPTGLEREKCDKNGQNCQWVGDYDGERSKELSGNLYWNTKEQHWESEDEYRARQPRQLVYDPMLAFQWRLRNWSPEQWAELFEQNDRARRKRNQDWLRSVLGPNSGDIVMTFIPGPKILRAFPGAKRAKSKTPVQGGGGLRKRWKDKDGTIYEWDSKRGRVEKYDKRGNHLGEFDAETGVQTQPPNPTRKVEP